MMAISGNYVYVANSGGLGIDSVVTVIDYTTDNEVNTIKVGDSPSGIAVDGNGKIWVLCKGKGFTGWPQSGDTPGKLLRINPSSQSIDFTFHFSSTADHPEKLVINKQKSMLYFLFNFGIYQFNVLSETSTPQQLVSRYFYSLGYENKTGFLYASDPKDFSGNGYVFRIKAQDGEIVDSIEAGLGPRGYAFPE
jgi:YVTN family beta-propeller protein